MSAPETARDVIAAHSWEVDQCRCGANCGGDRSVHAAHQLDALTEAGYAIVKLPEPDMTGEHATPEVQHAIPAWMLHDGLDEVVSTCCGAISVTGGTYEADAGPALAAAILAAAAHAEAGESGE